MAKVSYSDKRSSLFITGKITGVKSFVIEAARLSFDDVYSRFITMTESVFKHRQIKQGILKVEVSLYH